MNESTARESRHVLYTCSYVPEEIILAAGFEPRRYLPKGSSGDAYIHPNTCGYVKSMLNAALEEKDPGTAAIVIANSCDAMRRLYDLWQEYVPAVPAFFLDVPKRTDTDSIAFFATELRKLAEGMERDLSGAAMSDENLRGAIETCNEVRSLMREVFREQRSANGDVRGTEVFELCLEGATSTKADFTARIRRFLAAVPQSNGNRHESRILLAGGVLNSADLIAEVENTGARVIVLDSCVGLRHYDHQVEELSPDPMEALARTYLAKPACARMEGIEQRIDRLAGTAKEAGADAVVFCSVKFCDTFLYDIPMMSQRFKELGIPFLWIEHDYAAGDVERDKNRVETFLEVSV